MNDEIMVLDHGFVRLDGCMADDLAVVNAARVSFARRVTELGDADRGLVRFLMRERHSTPFEHGVFRFHIKCPIFVAREWMRHRAGSYNEHSARYSELPDEFYVPAAADVRTQVGKPGAYTFEPVHGALAEATRETLTASYRASYDTYRGLIEQGVAREIARMALPVGIYTQFHWTLNARSLMNFLSLRNAETAQLEIRRFAEAVEQIFSEHMPVTHAAFVEFDRARTLTVEVAQVGDGIHRVTLELPWALDHVHCYALEDPAGWTLVDCGLGTPETEAGWREALRQLGDPAIRRIVITHYHSDHIGASAALADLTGATEIVQGREDRAATMRSFGAGAGDMESPHFLRACGMPEDQIAAWLDSSFVTDTRFAEPTRLVEEGDEVEIAGTPFRVLVLRGHADGHIVLYDERGGRMLGGDVLLQRITPNVGAWEDSRPDPLGDYLETLRRIEELAPRVIYPGHRALIENAAERAAETRAHHAQRLDATVSVLETGRETPYDVSVGLWPKPFGLHERRFAMAEALAHLIRLGVVGRAIEFEPGRWRAAA